MSMASLLVSSLPLSVPPPSPPNIHRAAWHATTEEHVEDLLGGHVALEPVGGVLVLVEAPVPLAPPAPGAANLLVPVQVVLPLLLRLREDSVRISNGLECLTSSRSFIFIRMKGKCKFSVSFLQFCLRNIFPNTKYFIIIFTIQLKCPD